MTPRYDRFQLSLLINVSKIFCSLLLLVMFLPLKLYSIWSLSLNKRYIIVELSPSFFAATFLNYLFFLHWSEKQPISTTKFDCLWDFCSTPSIHRVNAKISMLILLHNKSWYHEWPLSLLVHFYKWPTYISIFYVWEFFY